MLRSIERGEICLSKILPEKSWGFLEDHYGVVKFISTDGWGLAVFFDCGEWDYFEWFIDPGGSELQFEEFSEALKGYRPSKRIRERMFGEPGYLGSD